MHIYAIGKVSARAARFVLLAPALVLVGGLMAFAPTISNTQNVNPGPTLALPTTNDSTPTPSSDEVSIRQAIAQRVQSRPADLFEGRDLNIHTVRIASDWAVVMAGLLDKQTGQAVPSGGILILAHKQEQAWSVAFLIDPNFQHWLPQVPETILPAPAKSYFTTHVTVSAPANPNASAIYSGFLLPYPAGAPYPVTQGNNQQNPDHVGPEQYAFDFGMPIHSVIVAAKGGTVKLVHDTETQCGNNPALIPNYIVIDHGDGTQGEYLHLDTHGALVGPGKVVAQGDPIAYSGDTGYTIGGDYRGCGAHLHFQDEVSSPNWWSQSVQIRFSDPDVLRQNPDGIATTGNSYVSNNYQILSHPKAFSTAFPWYYLISTGDERVVDVSLDGNLIFSAPDCAKALWVSSGNHTVSFRYRKAGNDIPEVDLRGWPFADPACAASASGTPPPVSTPPSLGVDDAGFISDVNYPDGAGVSPNQAFVKTWRMQNTGASTWGADYQLAFIGGDPLNGPASVDLPQAVGPGQQVDISVNLQAPASGGSLRGNWRLRNAQGVYFGPEIWVAVRLPDGPTPTPPPYGTNWSDVSFVGASYPTVVSPGQSFQPQVTVHIVNGQLLESRGDMLLTTDNNLYGAYQHVGVGGTRNAGQDYTFQFYAEHPITAPSADGHYESRWRVWRNGNWAGPEIIIAFDVRAGGGARPGAPALQSPGNWNVSSSAPSLCVTPQAGVQYDIEIHDSAANPTSNWTSNNCWTPGGLSYDTFHWHAKVRSVATLLESDWSDTWNFTLVSPNPSLTDLRFNPSSPSAAESVQVYACAPGTWYLDVNSATDGSASGAWREIDRRTVGSCNAADSTQWITWPTLRDDDGTHRLRFRVYLNGQELVSDAYSYTLNHRRPGPVNLVNPTVDVWLNTRTVTFNWDPTSRTQSYYLNVATDSNGLSSIRALTLPSTSFTLTLDEDYPNLWWFVNAHNNLGDGDINKIHFGVDRDLPTSAVTALPPVITQTTFTVFWGGSDPTSGVRWYDVQVLDATHPGGQWNNWLASTNLTVKDFVGQTGHTYCFQSRAMDNATNWESYPAAPQGDTCTQVNPSAAPPTPWWDAGYAHKFNIYVLNTDSNPLPQYYPLHLHLDNSTTPSATDVYSASVATHKGDDVRVVSADSSDKPRYIQTFSPTAIDIWYRLPSALPAYDDDGTTIQLYYGNPVADVPANDPNAIFLPQFDPLSNTLGLWHLLEGSGTSLADSVGGHTGTAMNMGWATGKFGPAGDFNGSSSYVNLGTDSAFNVSQLTAEAWVYTRGAGETTIFRKESSDRSLIYDFIVQGHDVILRLNGNNGSATASNVLNYNQWYHIAGTYDGATIKIYVNGQNQAAWNTSYSVPLRTGTSTLYFGGDGLSNNKYFNGMIQHARLSNVARTSFSYGQFGTVLSEPEVKPSTLFDPPVPGNPDLTIQGVIIFPYPAGGQIVQAVVQNVGNKTTGNGFYTDLYLNQAPAGAGSFSGSVQFWIDDPIAAGETVTLTSVITSLAQLSGAVAAPLAPGAEVSGTLYAQVDSAGVVSDTSRANNIFSTGAPLCVANADGYEPDDTPALAKSTSLGFNQVRNFTSQGDQDWVTFAAHQGVTYTISTSGLSPLADTMLALYGSDHATLLASNDDWGTSLASRIDWAAPADGVYYLLVRNWNPSAAGCGTSYTVSLALWSPPPPQQQSLYLPLVVH